MSLRRRFLKSPRTLFAASWVFASYLRLAFRTSRIEMHGKEALTEALKNGPVIMVLWHSRIAYSPYMFDMETGHLCTVTAGSHAARLAGATQAQFGMDTVQLASRQSNTAEMKALIRMVRAGTSLGFAADGPQGPRNILKSAPLDWARITGLPIFMVSFSVRRFWQWGSWDRLMFPWPFGRGVVLFRRWDMAVPRKANAEEMEQLRQKLEADLSALSEESDRAIGHDRYMT